ncbi:hypothetical protein J3R83DRAFT_5348 [Lanmaoa asiatica]|nr:hypothetical protein J3R83DRAFT_5348 [Lanmaoa asiatica]
MDNDRVQRVGVVAHVHEHNFIRQPSCDSAASGSVARNLTGLMAVRTVSELANWDGHLDQQRENSKWRHSSSNLARDSYHTPLENQPFELSKPSGRFLDQKRVEQSASHSNLERDSSENSPANARLPTRVDTTPTPSHDIHQYHHPSISHTVPNPALSSSPFIASSKSSHFTPSSSVLTSRVHNSRPPSSREHTALSRPALTAESEVIDLTIGDTEDELSVSDMLVPNSMHSSDQCRDPGPSRQPLSSRHSPPIASEQSLFTPPPPPRRRTRVFIDYLAVPPFPKGSTKADYQPISGHFVVPPPEPTVTNTLKTFSLAETSVTEECTPSLQKWKGKEREHDVVSPRKKYKRRAPPNRADAAPSTILDAFYEPTMIPLQDVDTYPPLTNMDLATNTRFQFAHAWRGHAARLREAELDWVLKFRLLGKACIWVRSVDTSSPRIPGTAGCVSSEQLRSWELVLPDSSPQEKSVSDELDHATESHSVIDVDANFSPLPDDALPTSSVVFDPALSNSTLSQGFSSTTVDMEHDMNQYFNGLSDSPNKHGLPRQHLSPMHTFRPRLLQSAGHAQMNSLGSGFPSLDLDPRLADTGGHECFLGVPPSPTTADMESTIAPRLTPDSPFEPMNYTASPTDIFGGEALPAHTWLFEQADGLLPVNDSPPTNHVPSAALGTINPSLLGPGQSSLAPKDTTPKRRSKLPEPVIYIRRPIDSSTLPLVSGKRPVQIKYRDSGGPPSTPSTQSRSKEASLNVVEHPIELPTNDRDDSPRAKRRSAPSRKLREYHATSESDSDFIPETSKSESKIKIKIKPKPKRSGVRDNGLVTEGHGTEAGTVPTVSFCHQCRHSSERPKMLCSNTVEGRVCGKRFCDRCILYRYPDVTFDQHSAGFLCPACTNTCNCSHCARSRGEEFVSMRLGGLAASIFKTKVTFVRDVSEPPHRVKPSGTRRSASEVTTPTPEPGVLPTQSQFWAHVYGMEGEHMGSAFMTREHMERLHTHGPSPSLGLQPPKKAEKPTRRGKKREKPRGPRVFVGRPLESWKVRALRDLEPSVDVETIRGKGKGKGNTADNRLASATPGSSRRRRCFIGNPVPLHEPYGRMPGTVSPAPPSSRSLTPALDSDGSLTPLSELEADYWPQPEVGECCSWAPPPPPGTIVHSLSSDSSSFSGPFSGEVPGPGLTGVVGTETDLVGQQGSGVEINMDMDLDVNKVEQGSASTALSEEDLARAISAALAALSVAGTS